MKITKLHHEFTKKLQYLQQHLQFDARMISYTHTLYTEKETRC